MQRAGIEVLGKFAVDDGICKKIAGAGGIKVVNASLSIQGVGSAPPVIDCGGHGRAFSFNATTGSPSSADATPGAGATLRLIWLTVWNAKAPLTGDNDNNGGAVRAGGGGTLSMQWCTFSYCTAAGKGGAPMFGEYTRLKTDVGEAISRCRSIDMRGPSGKCS